MLKRLQTLVFSALGLLALPARAETTTAQMCVETAGKGQEQRDGGDLLKARESFIACAQESCPAVIRADCAGWLRQVVERTPSVVIRATDPDGQDLVDVKVGIDGREASAVLDGKAIPLNPGAHQFHFETAGYPPIDATVVVRELEQGRVVSAQFGSSKGKSRERDHAKREVAGPLALVGVGVLGLGAFAYLAATGTDELSSYDQCKPHCDKGEVEATRTKLIVGDLALGAGLLAVGAGAVWYLTSGPKSEKEPEKRTARLRLGLGSLFLEGSY